jgi:hypothetical protein
MYYLRGLGKCCLGVLKLHIYTKDEGLVKGVNGWCMGC